MTQTLRLVASEALRTRVPGARVTLDRPEEAPAAARDEPRLNIYLVQVGIDPGLRNRDLPTRSSNGSLVAVPQVPVTLRYLFTYFGTSAQAHLMLGAIEVALHESPVLAPAAIAQAVEQHAELQGSDLDRQEPPVRVVPAAVSLETLSRFWAGFFQMPYTLSTVHDVAPVLLSSTLTPTAALPVRTPLTSTGGLPPALDPLPSVTYAPGVTVPVSGRGVASGQYVGIDAAWSAIERAPHGGLAFRLPEELNAGTREARLGAPPPGGGAPRAIPGARASTIDVCPRLQALRFDGQHVHAQVQPAVEPHQTVTLTLYPVWSDGQGPSMVIPTTVTAPKTDLAFPLPAQATPPTGSFLATVSVDGAASALEYGDGAYRGPMVELT